MDQHEAILYYLNRSRFPDPRTSTEDGLVAVDGKVDPDTLLDAYVHGIFPWPLDDPNMPMLWFSPVERALIEPETFHI